MSDFRMSPGGTILASNAPLQFAENGMVRCCSRCPQTFVVKTRRVALTVLCQDCRDVLTPEERRAYKSAR